MGAKQDGQPVTRRAAQLSSQARRRNAVMLAFASGPASEIVFPELPQLGKEF